MSLKNKYRDMNGVKLVVGDLYLANRPGIYKLLEIGEKTSIIKKIRSARNVPIDNQKPKEIDNGWLCRVYRQLQRDPNDG